MRRANAGNGIIVIRRAAYRLVHGLLLFSTQDAPPLRRGPPLFLYRSLLKECIKTLDLAQGRVLHDHLIRNGLNKNLVIMNFVVDMYGSCGSIKDALHPFSTMQEKNVFSWTIIITACIKHAQITSALHLFRQMQLEGVLADGFTYSSILGAFTDRESLGYGQGIHACIIASGFHHGAVVLTALINMYGKCGSPEIARAAFDAIHERDAISWNSMIAAYAHHGHPQEALQLYRQMKQNRVTPTDNTFTSVLRACSTPEALVDGKQIHADIVDGGFGSDLVRTALVSMYGSCGSLEEAETVFHEIHQHDVVSLNAMIGAYVQHDCGKNAVELYGRMWKMGYEPTFATLVGVLSACALLGAATKGKKIHMLVLENGFEADSILATAIVSMYGKCGHLDDAWAVFSRIDVRDDIAWNAILAAHAQNGDDKRALELFKQMQEAGVKPDSVTYISVLCACSHSGSLEDAQEYFESMQKTYGIEPNTKHYACMIDLFGRAGLVEEAENFLKKMPIEPDTVVLTAFSGACRVHSDGIRGKWAAERIMDLDPHIEAPYITLSNFYASEGRWKDVANVRKKMEQNVQKKAGRSWIEVDNIVHEFMSGDQSHSKTKEIYTKLHDLNEELNKAGYVKEAKVCLHDMDERAKEGLLCHHSEMLAIAFGFLMVPTRERIRVFKNLPVCPDCHAATKLISKITEREIIVRDAYRFHCFVDGSCSCGDYW
eukprot:c24123_g10_i1 orf=115-2259(+)